MSLHPHALAASLSGALVLGGCLVGPPTVLVNVLPTAQPSPTASPAGSPTPGSTPSTGVATPTPGPSPSAGIGNPTPGPSPLVVNPSLPPPTAYPSSIPVNVVRRMHSGQVYDETGAPVDGATVTIKSTDASVGYSAAVTTSEGSYVVNQVPTGVIMEIVVTKNGWTSRRRTGSFEGGATQQNFFEFGTSGATPGAGAAFFISDLPEVARVEPVSGGTGIDATKVRYKLAVSEPLDAENRDRLLDAVRVWPADSVAAGGGQAVNLAGQADTAIGSANVSAVDGTDLRTGRPGVPYIVRKGTLFLDSTSNKAKGTWNADGTELTFEFNAALIASKTAEARYQIGLAVGTDNKKIEAKNNNSTKALGTDRAGVFGVYPPSVDASAPLIRNVFYLPALALADLDGDGKLTDRERWASTHDTVAGWAVKRDETVPKLLGLDIADNVQGHTRIELSFSEPMVAFNDTFVGFAQDSLLGRRTTTPDGNTAYNGSPAANWLRAPASLIQASAGGVLTDDLLDNFTFALGANKDDTKNTTLDGVSGNDLTVDATTRATFGANANDLERECRFKKENLSFATGVAASVTDPRVAQAVPGTIFIEVDDNNPSTVFLWIVKRPDFFPATVREIKAFAYNLADPAGNVITKSLAEKSTVAGTN